MDNGTVGEKRLLEAEDRGGPGRVAEEEEAGGVQVDVEPAPDAAAAKVGDGGEVLEVTEGDGGEGDVQVTEGHRAQGMAERLEAAGNEPLDFSCTILVLGKTGVDWHGDLAVGCNIQSQIPAGRDSNLIGHANLSNKGTGQVGIRLNSSEHLQIALLALVPIFQNIRKLLLSHSEST